MNNNNYEIYLDLIDYDLKELESLSHDFRSKEYILSVLSITLGSLRKDYNNLKAELDLLKATTQRKKDNF